jgi:TetR/AcrR family transcriptional regulator, regulator of autoinduction and epiphytic fitness
VPDSPPPDRRSALKARHREAIVAAATALMERDSGTDFTVEELARQADVSRRTVFNHFDTVDDIVVAACGEVLGPVLATLDDNGPSAASMFDETVDALRRADVVTAMTRIGRMLGDPLDDASPRQAMLILRILTGAGTDLNAVLRRRHPESDALTVELLVSSFISGAITIHRHWAQQTGWRDDEESRRVWADLLDRLIDTIHSGHAEARAPQERAHQR